MNLATFVSASLFFLSISSKSIAKQNGGFNASLPNQQKLSTISSKDPFKPQNFDTGQTKSKTERINFITLQPTSKNLLNAKDLFLKTVLNNTKGTTKIPNQSVNINFKITQTDLSKNDSKISDGKVVAASKKNNDTKIIPAKDAGDRMKVPPNEEKIGFQKVEDQYNWVSLYDTCSVSCGGGYQNYNIVCFNGTVQISNEQPCAKAKAKPTAGKAVCGQQPCFLPRWEDSEEWTMCSVTCGTGERVRFKRCVISWSGPTKVREVEARMCNPKDRTENRKETCTAAVTCPSVILNRQGDCKGSECTTKATVKGIGGAAELSHPGLSPLVLMLFICTYFYSVNSTS